MTTTHDEIRIPAAAGPGFARGETIIGCHGHSAHPAIQAAVREAIACPAGDGIEQIVELVRLLAGADPIGGWEARWADDDGECFGPLAADADAAIRAAGGRGYACPLSVAAVARRRGYAAQAAALAAEIATATEEE